MLLQTTPFHPHPHLHIRKRFHFPRNPSVPLRISASQNGDKEDFITRVLKQNPSQVEPKFLIGQTLYTQKQKDEAFNKSRQNRWNWLRLMPRKGEKNGVLENEEVGSEAVFLKDILREHKGKLYVPEQIFGTRLSEEEEFARDLESLPVMSLEEFRKAVENDKVKVVISKDESYGFGNFIVELKEIPGDKSLQRTKWCENGVSEFCLCLPSFFAKMVFFSLLFLLWKWVFLNVRHLFWFLFDCFLILFCDFHFLFFLYKAIVNFLMHEFLGR